MKNLFLTGEIKTGKSTILNRVLQEFEIDAAGFKTPPYLEENRLQGFYLKSLLPKVKPVDTSLIGKKQSDDSWTAVPTTFNTLGVNILEDSLKSEKSVIIMDELGFFETQAVEFQESVFKCLRSAKPVLGVIKPLSSNFLNQVRSETEVEVLEVTVANREEQYQEFKRRFKEVIECPLSGQQKV